MNFQTWLAEVPASITGDALWHMEVYRVALFIADLAWHDVTKLMQDRRTMKLADQLFAAVGSVGANISEGYSRSSHKDQARFYEYALGSARESRTWYFDGRHLLGQLVTDHRLQLQTQVIRQLLKIIPHERALALREEPPAYYVGVKEKSLTELLEQIPMSDSPAAPANP
jgi:four helix bundle protein